MPVHIWICVIALFIAAILGAVYAFAKWMQHIMIERDLEEFHKEFGPLVAGERAEAEKKE